MLRRKYKYDFSGKKESEEGIYSLLYACVSLVLIAVSFVFNYLGITQILSGVFGLSATVLSFVGFTIAVSSFKDRNRKHNFSVLGILLNGLLAISWLGLFLAGIR